MLTKWPTKIRSDYCVESCYVHEIQKGLQTCATLPIFEAPQLITWSSCSLKKRLAFSGSPPAANASWIARKNGDDRKIPCGTVLKTSSHSPAISSNDVGTDGASLFKDSILELSFYTLHQEHEWICWETWAKESNARSTFLPSYSHTVSVVCARSWIVRLTSI